MTADEKALCNQLDSCNLCIDGEWRDEVAEQAAALIRRQAEEIDMLARALVETSLLSRMAGYRHLRDRHAAALAIAKQRA